MSAPLVPLRHAATVLVSNVDKKVVEGDPAVRLVNYTDVYYNCQITPDMDLMAATAQPEQIARFQVQAGDTIITKDSESPEDIGIPTYVAGADPDMVCGYHLALIRPGAGFHPKFLHWVLESDRSRQHFSIAANGMTRFGLTYTAIQSVAVPCPPLTTQRRIADFLDDQTTRIDRLVDARAGQARLLAEQMRSYLDDAIWVGRPRSVRLSRLSRLQSGITVDAGRDAPDSYQVPYIRVANVQAGGLELSEIKYLRVDLATHRRFALRHGDVLMTEGGDLDKLGRGTVWRDEVPGAIHQNHVFAVRVGPLLNPQYLAYVTSSSPARAYFETTGTKTTNLASTSASKVTGLPVPLRSLDEQGRIVREVAAYEVRADEQGSGMQASIALLQEFKRSLISAAVSGEFDVSTASGRGVPA